jgi:RHS repeat-associated protein
VPHHSSPPTALLRRTAALVFALALLAPALHAQTAAVYQDDFQSYGTQKNPPGWVDTSIGSSKPNANGLYKTWPDPTQGNKGPNVVFGTKQSSGKPEGNNPRIGTFSTYTAKTFGAAGRFEFSGRLIRTNADSRIGLTFFSSYPEKDQYYLLGLWSHPSGNLTMQLFGFGGPALTGTTASAFTPLPNKWYRFLIRCDDAGGKTVIRAKFWLDTNPEPDAWNIDAADAAPGRLKSGRIGLWAAVKGDAYIDDLSAKSPVDHAPPTIEFLADNKPLTSGLKFNHAIAPDIVVTDDSSTPAFSATLDGTAYNEGTLITQQGEHTLAVEAVDGVGNRVTKSVTFFIDTIPPVVTIVKPLDGSRTAEDVTVALQVVDASLPYTATATLDNAPFNLTSAITAEGAHTLVVTATDAVGLISQPVTSRFIIDRSNPTYQLFANGAPLGTNEPVFGTDVTITITTQDLTPVDVQLQLDGSAYTSGTLITTEQKHTISGVITDGVGHTTTVAARTFWIDKTAPVVELRGNTAALKDLYDVPSLVLAIDPDDITPVSVSATLNGQAFHSPQTLTEEREYTLSGTVTDAANHVTPFGPRTFTIDRSDPVITLRANGAPFPANGHIFTGDVEVTLEVRDLTLLESSATLDGVEITAFPLRLTEEHVDHVIKVTATDRLNHSATAGPHTFTIDKLAPIVTVTQNNTPLEDGTFFNRAITPVVNVVDITDTNVDAKLNGQTFRSGTEVTADGTYTLTGTVTDAAARVTQIGPITFTIDTIAPTGVFMEGDDKPFPNGKNLKVDAVRAWVKVTDANPLPATILLNGETYAERTPITAEDAHSLTATLIDKAGNTGVVPPVTFRIDRTPPVLTLFAFGAPWPARPFETFRDVPVTYEALDVSRPIEVAGKLGTQTITLPYTIATEGEQTLTATATDDAGNVATAGPFTFTIDKTPPSVEVLLNGAVAGLENVFKVPVSVTLRISSGLTSRTNAILINDQVYVEGTAKTEQGEYVVTGTVTTGSGLVVPIPETTFLIDTTAPEVTLKNRDVAFEANGHHYNADVVPNVTCADNLTHCTVELTVDSATWTSGDPISAEGPHVVVAGAVDRAGNRRTLPPVDFVIDKTPPAIAIESPADGAVVGVARVIVRGTADDAVTITVNGTPAVVDTAAKTFATPELALIEGENELTVIAYDLAGNPSAPKTVRVVVDTRAPGLNGIQPAPNACLATQNVTVTGRVNDAAIVKVRVTLGGRVVENALDAQQGTFTAAFDNVAEGTQRITIEATDSLGHRTEAAQQVVVDRSVPVIDVLEGGTPLTARLFNRVVALTFRARDVDPNVTLTATLAGKPYVSGTPLTAHGAYHLDVVAGDCAGNQFALPIDLELDLVAPAFDSLVPANGAVIGAKPASITGHVSADAIEVALENRGGAVRPDANGNFALGTEFVEGVNEFTLRATDAAGNITRQRHAFTVRSGAPTIRILESGVPLANNALFNRPVRPTVEVSDPSARVLVLINEQTDNGEPLTADGSYTIVVTAQDDLQRSATEQRTFTIDRTPPVIHITSPIAGNSTSSTVTLAGTADDAIALDVFGAAMTPGTGGAFTRAGVPLDLGENVLTVSGTDRAGNTGYDTVTVTWLGEGPALIITQPFDGSLTNRPRIDVAGRVLAPLPGGEVIVGSKSVPLDATGAFRATDYQLVDGVNQITARIPNSTTATVTVTADFTPPSLTVVASGQPLADNAQFPDDVSINVNASDDRELALTRVTVDGTQVATLPHAVSAPGGHVLSAIARDRAGNETRVERTFFIGATSSAGGCTIETEVDPPNGATIAPPSNATVASVRITGRAPGAAGVTVNGANAELADGTFAATVELTQEGANTIELRCRDASGVLSQPRSIIYYRVSGNPSVRITAPAEDDIVGLTTTVRGEVGADVVSADVNGRGVTIVPGNPRTFVLEDVALAKGVNVLVAHARNAAHRTGAHSVRVYSEQNARQIRITSPQPNAIAGALKITVSGTYANLTPQTLAITGGTGSPAVQFIALSDTTGTFVFRNVGVAAGANTLTVTGRNTANANASASVAVNGDAAAPAIDITAPLDNAWLPADAPVSVTGTFANASGSPRVEINNNPATVNASASSYAGTVEHTAASTFTPVTARLLDAAGNGPSATVTVRKLAGPLRIVSTFPAADANEGLDPATIVLIDFSAPLDRATVGNIHLSKGNTTVATSARVEDDIVVLTPDTLLEPGVEYRVDVPLSVKDVAGHSLAEPHSFTFTTLATSPSTPPQLDPIDVTGCPAIVELTGSAPPFARLILETASTVPFDAVANASGRFTIRFPLSGRSGFQSGRLSIIGADGSRSPAAPVSFRMDCAGPQVVGASFDRDANVIAIAFSKPVAASTIEVGTSITLTVSDGTTSGGSVTVSGASVTIVPTDDLRVANFTIEVKTTVTDTSGNPLALPFVQTFSVGGDEQPAPGDGSGFLSGEVYDASTGRPLPNVTVASIVPQTAFARVPSTNAASTSSARYTIVGTPSAPGRIAATATEIEVSRITDDRGRYVFALPEGAHTIEASAHDYTTVWRQVLVPAGAGVVPIDIRVQRRGEAKPATTLPLTTSNGGEARSVTRPVKLTVSGGVAPDAKVSVTAVGAQSLAGLLPLGWSPLSSAEVAVFGADNAIVPAAPLTGELEFTLPTSVVNAASQKLSLVQYDSERDEWRVLVPELTVASGDAWRAPIHASGAYAVVYRDIASGLQSPPEPIAGATLQAAEGTCAPCALPRKAFDIEPHTIAPADRAVATLEIEGRGENKFPSGTAVQAYVNEVLTLSDGGTVVVPPFTADVLVYRSLDGTTGVGEFVLAPSETARTRVLESGVDQVRILHYPGRLDRGSLIGSEGGRVPGDDAISLEIPSGATSEELLASVAALDASQLPASIEGFDILGGFEFTMSRAATPPPVDGDGDGTPDAPPALELSRAARATLAVDTTRLTDADAQLILAEVVPDSEWGSFYRIAAAMTRLDAPQPDIPNVRYTSRTPDSELPVDGVYRTGRYLLLAAKAKMAIATGVIASSASGPTLTDARITSSMANGGTYGVFDVTRGSGVFAVPIPAAPATNFTLTPRHDRFGIGRAYTAAAPAAGAVVRVTNWTFEVQPLRFVRHTPAEGTEVPAAIVELTAEFDLPVDSTSIGGAILVANTDGGIPFSGAAALDASDPRIIRWTSTGPAAAGATYSVTIQPSIRATNGASFSQTRVFTFRTTPLPRDGVVRPELIHITMPNAQGIARLYGTAGAIPPLWRVNVLRPGRGFRTTYNASPKPDGSFEVFLGGNDPYDRISIEDIIELQVLNAANNVRVTLQMPPFVTDDGLGFVARPERESAFTSAQGVKLVVAEGTFDRPTLITTNATNSAEAFAGVPNFDTEIRFHRAVSIRFEGLAQKKIELWLPMNGLPLAGHDYILGLAEVSVRGPRISVASLLREDGNQFTTYFPPPPPSGARGIASQALMSFPTASSLMTCMPGVMTTGTYGLLEMTPPGGGMIAWATIDTMRTLDMFNSAMMSWVLPGYRHYSRKCATVPTVAGQPFTLVGVDPDTGAEVFSTTYPKIDDPDTVSALPNPNPDHSGPFPIFATPFRVEQIDAPPLADTNGDGVPDSGTFIARGMKVTLESGTLTIANNPFAAASDKLPPKTKIRAYNLTRSRLSAPAEVSDENEFEIEDAAQEGDQIYVYLSGAEVDPTSSMSVVMSEPIDVGVIPPSVAADSAEEKKLVDEHLRTLVKFEQILTGGTVDLTAQVFFEAQSGRRRIKITTPAMFVSGGHYRITLKKTLKDVEGNFLAERKSGNDVIGTPADDLSMDFVVRPAPDSQVEFNVKPNDAFAGAALREIAKYGNLAFVAAQDGGLLAYDLSDPSSLATSASGVEPKPIAVVPGGWRNATTGGFVDGVAPMWDFWTVATDHHGRVYGGGHGGGFQGQFALLRSYRVEDFLAVRDSGSNCGAAFANNLNCKRYGNAVIGFRNGTGVSSDVGVTVAANQPTGYVRKLKLLVQDDTVVPSMAFADLSGGYNGVEVTTAPIGSSEYSRATMTVPFAASSSGSSEFLIQRVTVVNTTLDMRWHADAYKGGEAIVKDVIARKDDRIVVLRNRTTYAVVTMFGYGASVYDMNAVETNELDSRCRVAAFKAANAAACAASVSQEQLPEKVVVTNGDYRTACGVPLDDGETMRYAAEIFGIVRTHVDEEGELVSVAPDMTLFAVTGTIGSVVDMKFALASDANPNTAACATFGPGVKPPDAAGMLEIQQRVQGTQRLTNGALYHWEVKRADNVKGLRGSAPNTHVERDYLLVAANNWGLVVYEVGGTPPVGMPGYWPLDPGHVVDTIWIAAGAQAVSIIEGTDLAAVIDRKGRLLIVDLSNIDARWDGSGTFKLATNAMKTPTTVPNEIGVDDPRVIFKTTAPFAYGVMPPLVAGDTGIAFGGEILGRRVRVRPVLDPKIDFLIDAGKGMQPSARIVPLGVPYPKAAASAPEGSLSAFRVRVTLPGGMQDAITPDSRIHVAVESELVAGAPSPQTPRSLPRAHLRLNDRAGNEDKRKIAQFTLSRALPDIPTQEKEFKHQRGYNRMISPWIVAIADPRASERVTEAERSTTEGCVQCKRPEQLVGKKESDGVYEMFTNGRFVAARIDGNVEDVLPPESLPDFYDYLAQKGRFYERVSTVIADTARPKSALVPGQHVPIAQGTLDGTVYVHSGELHVAASDLTLLGQGPTDLQLTRSYRSRTIGGSPIGQGWEASYLRRVRELPNGDAEYRDSAGDLWTFRLPPSGPTPADPGFVGLDGSIGTRFRYDAPPGLYLNLMRTDEGWTMLDSKWRITRFDNMGRLVAETDEFWKPADFASSSLTGSQFRYFYDGEGRLAQILDPLGRVTSLAYYPPDPPNDECTDLGPKTTPCAYAGMLKEITDWRKRSVLYEYDQVGRLIGVQLPKVRKVDDAPDTSDFSTDDKRPRVRYDYFGSDAYPAEDATQQDFTDFLQYAGNLASITDPAQESGTTRVTYSWFAPGNDVNERDRLHHISWPCGTHITGCAPKQAKLEYDGLTAKITDLMDQAWEYTLVEGPDEQRKHITAVSAIGVPTYSPSAGAAPPLTIPSTGTGTTLTTSYENFDSATGIPRTVKLPSGQEVQYGVDAPPSNPKSHCKQITSVSESGSGASRTTKVNYDTASTAVCTAESLERNNQKRETQSANRERKTTVVDDPDANVKTSTQYDDYGRPVLVSTSGGASVSSSTVLAYKANIGDRIGWQRLAGVGDSGNSTQENYNYFEEGSGYRVEITDPLRNVTTVIRYNEVDQPIYRKVSDTKYGLLEEERMAYDADGRLVWSRRKAPSGNFDTILKYDPLGRVISTRTTGNAVDANPNVELEVKHEYDLTSNPKKLTVTDPAPSGGAAATHQQTTIDNLGRASHLEHAPVSGGGPKVVQEMAYDKHGKLSFTTDTFRTANAVIRDGLGREIETIGRDGVKQVMTWSTWDEPSEVTVMSGTETLSKSKRLFTEEGRVKAINEQVDTRFRQTGFKWPAGGAHTLQRIGETAAIDAPAITGGDVRGSLTMTDGASRVTDVYVGVPSGDAIGEVFHHTKYSGFTGDEPKTITENEPKRGASVTRTQELDGLNRVRGVTLAGEYESLTTYDVAGNVSDVTPSGHGNTHVDHDSRGLAYRIEKPGAENIIERKYDALGVLREIKDETNQYTFYKPDALGRIIEVEYPDGSEFVDYEDVTGVVKAQRDRKGQWLSYSFDDGGRIETVHDGRDPSSAPVIQRIEYDTAKRVSRIANADAAIEYADYDFIGRPRTTRTYRYSGSTGLKEDPVERIISDVHSQSHEWSIFDSERTSWRMPVTGATPGAANGSSWRSDIAEKRDAGANMVEQLAGSLPIANATAGGIGRITSLERATTAGGLRTEYSFADAPASPGGSEPAVGASGVLLQARTKRGLLTLAGTKMFPDNGLRARTAMDLGLGRRSKWLYDDRGRLEIGKLLIPPSQVESNPGTVESLSGADFRRQRDTLTFFGPDEHNTLGPELSLTLEPLSWIADEEPGHRIDRKRLQLDATEIVREFEFDGGRRTDDGVWKSTYDQFGRLIGIESVSLGRRIEYVYGPNDRIVGRKALDFSSASPQLETRAHVLAGDGLPAETTFVWDPVADRLVAIYASNVSLGVPGGSGVAAPDAGLVRQYVHGDGGYDDPVEVLAAALPGGTARRYLPVFDEAGTGSLQAVVDGDGNLAERVLFADSYGDAPRYLHGAVVEKVSYSAKRDPLGNLSEVQVSVRISEKVVESTRGTGYRLAAINDAKETVNVASAPPEFVDTGDDDEERHEVRWTFSATEWQAFMTGSGISGLEVAVASSLRTDVWGNNPVQEAPAWAKALYGTTASTGYPVIVRTSLTTLDDAPPNGDAIPLYEIQNLYLAASPLTKTHLLTGFKAAPFTDPATGLAYFRARWYDPATGTWLTPDPMGYEDSSNLYAFCAADPVNCADPLGLFSWDPAAWGHWIGGKAQLLKQKIGATSMALSANTGNRVLDEAINLYVGSVEAQLGMVVDFASGIPVGLLTIGEASGTSIAEEGCHDLHSCGMTISAVLGDVSSTILYALGIAGAAESRLTGLKPKAAPKPTPGPVVDGAEEAARLARVERIRTIREALTDGAGKPLQRLERSAVRDAIRRVEGENYRLGGSIKYEGNHGIDLYFRGTGSNSGRIAFLESKASGSLSSLSTDVLGIRQGSYEFFRTRLARAIVKGDPAMRNAYRQMYGMLRGGQADMLGYFGGSSRLIRFNFNRNANFRSTPGAASNF